MSTTSVLVLAHLGSTVALLAVLCLIITVQTLSGLVARLHGRWAPVRRRTGAAAPAPPAAATRFPGVDRRRPAHSSS